MRLPALLFAAFFVSAACAYDASAVSGSSLSASAAVIRKPAMPPMRPSDFQKLRDIESSDRLGRLAIYRKSLQCIRASKNETELVACENREASERDALREKTKTRKLSLSERFKAEGLSAGPLEQQPKK